jgi:hypothetical protein
VTGEELLAELNADAAAIGGLPITERMIRYFVDVGLIEARIPRGMRKGVGPVWHFYESAARHARKLCQMKSRGVVRAAALRVQLWVREEDYPIKGVREALLSEFTRLQKRNRRASRFNYDHRHGGRLSDTEMAKHSRRLPMLDPDLRADGFALPERVMVHLASELTWGPDNASGLARALEEMAKEAFARDVQVRTGSTNQKRVVGAHRTF